MNNSKITKCCLIAAAIALLAVFVAAPAGAGDQDRRDLNRLLTGDYYEKSFFTCANANNGFNDAHERNADIPGFPSVTVSGSQESITSYDGHGGWTSKGKNISISHDPGGSIAPLKSPISVYDAYCDGDYWVNPDLSVGGNLFDCTVVPSGAPYPPVDPDQYFLVTGLSSKSQLLGTMGNIIRLGGDTELNVEKVWWYNHPYLYLGLPNPWLYTQRECTRSTMGIKIVGKGEGFDLSGRVK